MMKEFTNDSVQYTLQLELRTLVMLPS